MTHSPNFLSLLSPTSRASDPALAQRMLGRLAGADSFEKVLEMARAGQVTSGLSVRVAPGSDVSLTPEQLDRLAHAADLAEAHGASRALFLIDGMAITMDVGVRTVLGAAPATGTRVLDDIDAVVTVGARSDANAPSPLAPLRSTANNPSLLRALSGQD